MNNLNGYSGMNLRNANNRLNYYSAIPPQMQLPNPQMVNYQPQQQYITNQSGVNTNMEFIQGGETAVNVVQLPNNSLFAYFDNDYDTVYFKTVDNNGRASVQAYDLVPKDQTADAGPVPTIDTSEFVTKEQFDELSDRFTQQMADIVKKLNDFKSKIGNMNKKEANK